ncbi:MAG: helix-turn-helix transcriptional regulator [Clostridia bacterium]|nr:helix-turn-helix transcriptional regulator [Clostridia bacterium]
MKISFNDIKPFLRFVRYLELNQSSSYSPSIPYDARLFYTLDGDSIIKANNKTYHMKKQSLLFINSDIEYHLVTPKNSVVYLAINFDFTFSHTNYKTPLAPDVVKEYNKKKLIEKVEFSDSEELNQVLYIENIPSIEKKLISMEKEYLTKVNLYELKLSSSMTDILIKCLRHIKNNTFLSDNKELAVRIIKYISVNYDKKLTNIDIANHFNYHPNYISNLVKQYTGYPLNGYLNLVRTTKASEMLTFTDKSISEVAYSCGFYDASHFIKCFKKTIGITPQQYRNNY